MPSDTTAQAARVQCAVLRRIGKESAKTGIVPTEFHRYLIEGQEGRNIADDDAGSSLSQAQEHMARAEQFLRFAERLIGPMPT